MPNSPSLRHSSPRLASSTGSAKQVPSPAVYQRFLEKKKRGTRSPAPKNKRTEEQKELLSLCPDLAKLSLNLRDPDFLICRSYPHRLSVRRVGNDDFRNCTCGVRTALTRRRTIKRALLLLLIFECNYGSEPGEARAPNAICVPHLTNKGTMFDRTIFGPVILFSTFFDFWPHGANPNEVIAPCAMPIYE